MYEMVTGQQPFHGDYEQAVIYSILNENPKPMTPVSQNLAAVLIMARRYDEAIAQAQKTIDMAPNFMLAYFRLGMAYEAKGIYEKALQSYRKANALAGGRNEMVRLSLGRIRPCRIPQASEELLIEKYTKYRYI